MWVFFFPSFYISNLEYCYTPFVYRESSHTFLKISLSLTQVALVLSSKNSHCNFASFYSSHYFKCFHQLCHLYHYLHPYITVWQCSCEYLSISIGYEMFFELFKGETLSDFLRVDFHQPY